MTSRLETKLNRLYSGDRHFLLFTADIPQAIIKEPPITFPDYWTNPPQDAISYLIKINQFDSYNLTRAQTAELCRQIKDEQVIKIFPYLLKETHPLYGELRSARRFVFHSGRDWDGSQYRVLEFLFHLQLTNSDRSVQLSWPNTACSPVTQTLAEITNQILTGQTMLEIMQQILSHAEIPKWKPKYGFRLFDPYGIHCEPPVSRGVHGSVAGENVDYWPQPRRGWFNLLEVAFHLE